MIQVAKLANRERDGSEYIPYRRHIDETTISLEGRGLLSIIEIDGLLFETADTASVNSHHYAWNTLLRNISVLRRGDEVMCVFNERFDPIGIDPGTRTVSAGVARVTKLALPDASPKPAKPDPVSASVPSPLKNAGAAPAMKQQPGTTAPLDGGVAQALRNQRFLVPPGMTRTEVK